MPLSWRARTKERLQPTFRRPQHIQLGIRHPERSSSTYCPEQYNQLSNAISTYRPEDVGTRVEAQHERVRRRQLAALALVRALGPRRLALLLLLETLHLLRCQLQSLDDAVRCTHGLERLAA